MAEFINRIDLVVKLDWDNDLGKWTLSDADLDEITTVTLSDAVHVVRCANCQEYDEDNEYCRWLSIYACPFFYCAHGDRKDDGSHET